ncbi:MAG: CHC2 zinc finger domain-containing protein [Methylovulum miyakonense]|uniref:CHC2 zinc finger domain-containing protein n=1 Tax=Methylovulum miyakonense TaxID=645578 RepID=UPI003BB6C34F
MQKKTTRAANTGSHQINAHSIKKQLNPLDLYRHELPTAKLKKHGWNDGGLCPFHADNHAGSFHVNVVTGAYKCFACGAAGSDVIAFTMALYGLKFVEALEQLANDWGLV